MAEKKRNSNLELMRILCMLLIVFSHCGGHGFESIDRVYSFNKYCTEGISLLSTAGVMGFVLISGYFVSASGTDLKRLMKLWGQIWFYSVLCLILFLTVLTPAEPLGAADIIKSLLPVTYSRYWFATCYIMLMLLSPFLNSFIASVGRGTLLRLIVLLVLLWSVLATFFAADYGYNIMGWFVVLYLISGYIRRYYVPGRHPAGRHLGRALAAFLLLLLSDILINLAGKYTGSSALLANSVIFAKQNGIFDFVVALELFLYFLNREPFYNRAVNIAASACFGVYLIHDNFIFRPYLWETLLHMPEHYVSSTLPLYVLISVLAIYIACTLIDLLRIYTVERLWMKFVAKAAPPLNAALERLMTRLQSCADKLCGNKEE